MSKNLSLIIALITILLTACGGNLDNPPLVYLVSDGEPVNGFQGSYCWEEGPGSAICVDMVEPYFDQITQLPANQPIRFQLDKPLPNEVSISVSEELFGDTLLSETIPVTEFIEWSPTLASGAYIIAVHTSWKQGAVTYWFSVSIK